MGEPRVTNDAAETARRDWAVTFKAGSKAPTEVLALLLAVPASQGKLEVEAALQAWNRWPAWQQRLGLGVTITVAPASKRHRTAIERQGSPVTSVPWSVLVPESRAVQINASGDLYAAMRDCARREGLSLAAWVTRACELAAGVKL